MITKLRKYGATLQALGYKRGIQTIRHRLAQKVQEYYSRPMQPTSWLQLQQLGINEHAVMEEFLPHQTDRKKLIPLADRYAQHCFDVLGSGEQCFIAIPWYRDIRLYAQNPQADCDFDTHTYFKNISIIHHTTHELGKDIKVPWELARFHYTPILGLAYHITKNDAYAQAAKKQLASWMDATTFCHGIHWFNGMEVSIRAVNWIVALPWLQKFFAEDSAFYQRLLCSLYDHMRYLENNWEWYDGRTNNHYVANLVGYAYLCWFFKAIPQVQQKWDSCYKELLQEFTWQIFDEGTSYEGSTRYHGLVTELFLHGFFIVRCMGKKIDPTVLEKLTKMMLFIEHCKPLPDADPIIIGDDDAGSLLDQRIVPMQYISTALGITTTQVHQSYYPQFGISLSKHNNWHISLRHHAYTNRQPTGHFHDDTGSITVAYKGIPLLVDPGTYVYTPSTYWRNYFRSRKVHNTMYSSSYVNMHDLFSMQLKERLMPDSFMTAGMLLESGMIKRTIIITRHEIRILDHCMLAQPQMLIWNFTFAPQIKLYQEYTDTWSIHTDQYQCMFQSSLLFSQYTTWLSSGYGSKTSTIGLQASQKSTSQIIETSFRVVVN